MPPDEANQSEIEKLRQLRQHLANRYDLEELRTLCFDLGVDYDSLRGEGKAAKARELVDYMRRRNRLAELETETEFQMVALSEEDSQFRAYFAALEKRFAKYDDPSKMIGLKMWPGTLSPAPPPLDNKPRWIGRSKELSRECMQPHYSARPPQPNKEQEIEEVAEYLWEKKRVVLLGEPGAGKSTTLRLLARAIWEEFLPGSATPPTLPLYAALNQWQKGSSLMEFLQSQITGLASSEDEEGDKAKLAALARRLPELVKAGRVVVLLDGLNELPGLERDKLSGKIDDERARMIERVAHEPMWEQTLCLLSCRIKDFAGDPVRWHDLHLQPLTRPQVEAFALAHYQDGDLTSQLIAELYDYKEKPKYLYGKEVPTARQKLRELCQQPFYLVRLLHYYREQGKLADNPAQLIKASVEAALAREVTKRHTMTQAESDELQTRLSYLAFNMTDAEKVGGVDKTTAAGWLFYIRERWALKEPEASQEEKMQAEKLIKQAEDANLASDSMETFQFYHQLLQEYFAASYLQSQRLTRSLFLHATNYQFNEVWPFWAGLDEKLVAQVVTFLKNEDSYVREKAAIALGRIGDSRAVEPLIAALKDEEREVRSRAASTLGEIGDSRAVEPLIAALTDEASNVRSRAASTLGRIGDSRAVEPLIVALKDEEREVRSRAARTLGEIGDSRAVEPLIAALEDENWHVRSSAAEVLGHLGDSRAIEPLIAALKDENWQVRSSAAEALRQIGDNRAVEPLIAALKDEDHSVRYWAAYALGKIGDSRALPELERLARKFWFGWMVKDAAMVKAAARAIKEIKKKQAGE